MERTVATRSVKRLFREERLEVDLERRFLDQDRSMKYVRRRDG